MTRLGYQIPNFTYPDVDAGGLFDQLVQQSKAAEAAGFDRLFLMDHFYQLPGIGDPDDFMLECYTTLAALAQHTETIGLSALVTGNTYRNPAVLAKTVTALDVVSAGRATLGLGSGWYQLEHDAYGIPFETFTERFEKLEEALQIILPMLNGERPTLDGKHYSVTEAINSPAPLSKIPVMIGGSGEKKTLRMVAQYGDESNLTCATAEVPRKLDALAAHCERLGRDRSEIVVTKLVMGVVAPTMERAEASIEEYIAQHGWPAEAMDLLAPMMTVGDPDTFGEQVQDMVDAGLDGITMNLATLAHDTDMIELAGEVCSQIIP